jgi:exodeoxyribonuclease V alpha subunit
MTPLIVTVKRVWPGALGGAVFTGTDEGGNAHRIVASKDVIHRAPNPGECWTIRGEPKTHSRFGLQIHAVHAMLLRPKGELLTRFLARNRAFQGIGEVRARKLWSVFGGGLYDLLDTKELAPISEILGEELAKRLLQTWEEFRAEAQVTRWLEEQSFPVRLATKVIRLWGTEAPAKIQENPYRLLAVAEWDQVDAVALDLGVHPEAPIRWVAAVEAVCYRAMADKHTVVPEAELIRGTSQLLRLPQASAAEALKISERDHAVLQIEEARWQAFGPYVMESFVRRRIEQMVANEQAFPGHLFWTRPPDEEVNSLISEFQDQNHIHLTNEQQQAVWMAMTQRFGLILGGAGTGKTTMLKAVHFAVEKKWGTVHSVALAGRAAMRMREATGKPARTIAGFMAALQRNDLQLGGSDLVIVDEASMVDLPLTYTLFRSIPEDCRVLMVGDPYQLPPIGIGVVFSAFCEDQRVPKVELTKVHRQASETGIPSMAALVRQGKMPDLKEFSGPDMGISFLDCSEEEALERIVGIHRALGGSPETQILGAVRRGPTGTQAVNQALHRLRTGGKPSWNGFSSNDPVIFLHNDYDRLIWNGTLGAVESVSPSSISVMWDGHERPLCMTEDDIDSLELAYAISIHKAQGSQFRRVIVPLFHSRVLDRTLIYTAITRGTEQIVLVGDRVAFRQAVSAPPAPHRRRHGLAVAPSPLKA